jgi:uridine kinase
MTFMDRSLLQKLIQTIASSHSKQRFILGVDGLSRSGKTTLTDVLCEGLLQRGKSVTVIHLDDHIEERNRRYNTGHREWYEYYSLQWDVKYLQENLFDKLRDKTNIVLPFYNSEQDKQVMKSITIPTTCIVIIEGVFLQRTEWRDYFDFVVYLDCPREVRFLRERESTRQNIEKFITRYWKAEDYYLDCVAPMSRADIIMGFTN